MKRLKIFTFLFLLIAVLFFAKGAMAAVPAAINDLSCVVYGTQGDAWLSWSLPSGTLTSYDLRYSQGPIDSSTFNIAWQFPQTWSGSTNQGIVTNLTGERNWYFAIKSINADGTSPISNIVSCYVPKITDTSDKIPPTSLITDPQLGSEILVNKDYVIKGTSFDTGGSSVKQVEISIDGGDTWKTVSPKASVGNGFTWEYLWSKPAAGLYLIKTRATDWLQNIEIQNAGISVQVSSSEVSSSAPQTPDSVLSAKIMAIQQQIIQLIMQLIALLKSGL
jgi:hypothetical protein